MYIKTNGLVLRETPYKESSRILTVLTSTEGKITVNARGAKRKNSKTAASTQFLSFSEMTLFHDRGRYTLTEARSIELFEGLRDDLKVMALAAYIAELLEAVSDEDLPEPEILSLGLNSLYVLSEGKKTAEEVKAVFETRLMCLAGYEPMLSHCAVCGREDIVSPVLSLAGGVVTCRTCREGADEAAMALTDGALAAMRYIAGAEGKKLFSFTMSDETLKRLSRISEAYTETQLGRSFAALSYYHAVV